MTVHQLRKGVARVARSPVSFPRICIIGVWERNWSALLYTHGLISLSTMVYVGEGIARFYVTRIAEHLLLTDQCRKSFVAKSSPLLIVIRSNLQSRHLFPLRIEFTTIQCSLDSPGRVVEYTSHQPASYHVFTSLAFPHRLTIQASRRTSRRI
jgi:hypothetical protein